MAEYENPYKGVTPLNPQVFDPSVYLKAYPKDLPSWLPAEQMQVAMMPGQTMQKLADQLRTLPQDITSQRRQVLANQKASDILQQVGTPGGPQVETTIAPEGATYKTIVTPGMLATRGGTTAQKAAQMTPKPAGTVKYPGWQASDQDTTPAKPEQPEQPEQPAKTQPPPPPPTPPSQPPPAPPTVQPPRTSQVAPADNVPAVAQVPPAQAPVTSIPAAVPSLAAAGAQPPLPYAPTAPQQATGQQIFNAYQNTISPDAQSWRAELTPTGQRTGRIIVQHRINSRTGQPVLPDQPIDPQWAAQNLFDSAARQAHPVVAGLVSPQMVATAMQNITGQNPGGQNPLAPPIQNVPGPGMNMTGPVGNAPIGALAAAPPIQNVPGPSINVPRGPIIPPGPQIAAAAPVTPAGPAAAPLGGPPPSLPSGPLPPLPGPVGGPPAGGLAYQSQAPAPLAPFNPQLPRTPAEFIAAGGGPEALMAQATQRAGARTDVTPRTGPTPIVRPAQAGGTPIITYPNRPTTPDHDADGNPTPTPGSTEYWSRMIGAKNPKDFGLVTTNPNIRITGIGTTQPTLNGETSDSYTYTASDGNTYTVYVDPVVGGRDANGRAIVNPFSQYSMVQLTPFSEERMYFNGHNVVVHNPLTENNAQLVNSAIVEQGVNPRPDLDTYKQLEADYLEAMQRKFTTNLPPDMDNEAKALQASYQLSNKLQTTLQQLTPKERSELNVGWDNFVNEHGDSLPDWLKGGLKFFTLGAFDVDKANRTLDIVNAGQRTFDQLKDQLSLLPEARGRDIVGSLGKFTNRDFPDALKQVVNDVIIPDSGRLLDHATAGRYRIPFDFKNMLLAGTYAEDRPGGTANHPVQIRNHDDMDHLIPQTYFFDGAGNVILKDANGNYQFVRPAAPAATP